MIIEETDILSDDSFGELASDKTDILVRRKPHEYN
jgi:hypothetical protein